uniref:Major facilitator superfamily domain-containing protein 6 n=1 Tax=Sipha flava TaxID=143950 RepID=A0A2S2RAT1_9HEMI
MTCFQINRKLLIMKIHYFIGIGGYAPFSPFMTTIAKQRGYSAFIVGLMFTLLPIPLLITTPIMTAMTDKYKCRRLVFIASSVLIFAFTCLLAIIPGTTSKEIDDLDVIMSPLFWLFFISNAMIGICGRLKSCLDDTICMSLLGEDKHLYGKQRLWGSIGWSLMAILSGACVDWYSKGQEYKNYTPGYIIALILFLLDIYVITKIEITQESDNSTVVSDVKHLLVKGKILAFLLWVVFIGFFMSFIWNYVFWYLEDLSNIYHPETLSWIKTLQGLALIVQCFGGEVPSFFLSSYVIKHVDHMNTFSITFLAFTVIFSSYSFITNPLWTLPIEVLNGVSYALSFSVAISYAANVSPVGAEGTLQGVVGTALTGIGSPLGSLIGGYMFKTIGSIASFKILSVVAFTTCITQIIVNQLIVRWSKNGHIKDKEYSKVETKDIAEDITTTI